MDAVVGSTAPALELRAITKHFGAVRALDNASLTVKKGTVHALLGENGAGKTTLMRIAFGLMSPNAGTILIDGKAMNFRSPLQAIEAGLGMVHQEFSLIPALSVAENVALGGRGSYSFEKVAARLEEVSRRTGLWLDPAAGVSKLSNAERQKLEIIRSLSHNARILILDEPTTALTSLDVQELFSQLRAFASDGGSVVLITHKLRDAIDNADEVTVLRSGSFVMTAHTRDSSVASLSEATLGTSSPAVNRRPRVATVTGSRSVISLRRVPIRDERGTIVINNASTEVHAGEIVGVAALDGAAAGFLRVLSGRIQPDAGEVSLPEVIGFVPENRHDDALIPAFTLTENVALRSAGSGRGLIDWTQIRQLAQSIVDSFDVRTPDVQTTAAELSGGNQQRFVLGRELSGHPAALVLENPTQGLDVNAATTIHSKIRAARDAGTAVVFYSSDLDELVELADRVLVIQSGTITSVNPERERIGEVLLATKTTRP